MNHSTIHAQAAEALRSAARSGHFIAPLRETFEGLSADDAYAIQKINTDLRLRGGARIVGSKIGLTSPAVQQQLGVDQPDYGLLFDDMEFGEGLPIPMAGLHQPKVEAEIAFVLGRDLDMERPGLVDVLRAVEFALPALEIVGSRIANWNIKFVDTVADNASASAFVLGGTPRKLDQFDMRACKMAMSRDVAPNVSTGIGAACLGHPLNAVVWLARTMARVGAPLKAGHLVLSGALGPMVAVEAGKRYTASIEGLGSVAASFS